MEQPKATPIGDREIAEIVRIARAAARLVMGVYATPFSVEMKGPGDPVTRADREANALICGELEASFPGIPILAEESVPTEPDEIASRLAGDRVFFVDPLDGTREFASHTDEFAVMIGLSEAGSAAAGVVVLPTTGEALVGRVAAGEAYVEAEDGGRRPLRVSQVANPAEAKLVVSRSHRPKLIEPLIRRLGIRSVVPCGSVGVKIARVVMGAADLYVHGGAGAKLWDSAAPEAILRAAGGRFTDVAGAPIPYRALEGADPRRAIRLERGLCASNGLLHDAALEATQQALREQGVEG